MSEPTPRLAGRALILDQGSIPFEDATVSHQLPCMVMEVRVPERVFPRSHSESTPSHKECR